MNRWPWMEGDGDELDKNGVRTNGEATTVCEWRSVTEKKEVTGGRSAGATIATEQNRRVGSLLHYYIPIVPSRSNALLH